MRRVLMALGITTALLTGTALAADAAPKTGSCVTIEEFAKVREGVSKASVAKTFGTKGKRVSIGTDQDDHTVEGRSYKVCKMVAAKVTVEFVSGGGLATTKVGYAQEKAWVQHWQRAEPA
ncbi:hypothetical protein LWF15_33280 [Kineosporia rhizophila]|uniref:hypothetical protein n=1 Tax=Kineosporia rhizophila TaxID=84633 RepID=UPI000B1ADA73|nr:hypothetical protein [Kineosporia rhizophila]MCE0540378.1 hypothetical protein [Kineosporia rhizophila]